MDVTLHTRHCNVPGRVRAEAEERVQKLERLEPRVENAIIEFDNDHGDKQVETRVFVAGSHSIVAHGSGESFRTALDRSLDRLTRQLKRRRERVRDHRSIKLGETFESREIRVRENTHD